MRDRIKRWYLNLSIARKLNLSYLMVIILPLILLAVVSDKVSSSIIIEKTINNSVQNLDLVTRSLEGLLDHVNDISKIVVSNNSIQQYFSKTEENSFLELENRQTIKTTLDIIIEPRNIVSSIVLYGYNGKNIGSGLVNETMLETFSNINDPYYHHMEENWGQTILVDTHIIDYIKESISQNGISILKPLIYTANGKIIGRAVLNVNEENLSKLYADLEYGKTGRFFIQNSEGVVISSSIKDELYQSIEKYNFFNWVKENDRSGKIFQIEGKAYLITSSKNSTTNWAVIGIIPLDELIDDNKKVTYLIYSIGLIFSVIAVAFSLMISRSISKPIIKLSAFMNMAGQGDFDIRVNEESTNEIGQLSINFNKMLGQISSLMKEVYDEQRKKRKFELLALQAQINPHFLYNTLESVCALAQMGREDDVFLMVKSLSMFYRIVLSKGRNIISLKEEFDNVNHYLTIQKMRYQDKFDYSIEYDESILNNYIIKLSIQPLVENSIYHGIRNKEGHGFIRITGGMAKGHIVISVIDDGIGFDESDIEKILNDSSEKQSFGLRSVDERIKLYFGNEYGIKIISKSGEGTKVDIILPGVPTSTTGGIMQ